MNNAALYQDQATKPEESGHTISAKHLCKLLQAAKINIWEADIKKQPFLINTCIS
jgi:hypothetical protein